MKMLVTTDGSTFSQRAMAHVAELSKHIEGLDVLLINVRPGPGYYGELPPFDYESIEAREQQRQQDLLTAALNEARRLGLAHVNIRGAEGEVAAEVVRAADDYGADQIVMGTHGRSTVGGLFLGSVAQRVVHLARVPVLLVK